MLQQCCHCFLSNPCITTCDRSPVVARRTMFLSRPVSYTSITSDGCFGCRVTGLPRAKVGDAQPIKQTSAYLQLQPVKECGNTCICMISSRYTKYFLWRLSSRWTGQPVSRSPLTVALYRQTQLVSSWRQFVNQNFLIQIPISHRRKDVIVGYVPCRLLPIYCLKSMVQASETDYAIIIRDRINLNK
jgi:hypothetical protein